MTDNSIPKKICRLCGEVKPLTDFSKNKRTSDGRTNRCKSCDVEVQQVSAQHAIHMPEKYLNDSLERDIYGARILLTILGYDVNGDVHAQFMERMRKRKG